MIFQGEYKVRYEILDQYMPAVINNIKYGPYINMVVDLKEIFRKLYRPDFLYGIDENDGLGSYIEELSSDIINLIGHYRNYFHKFKKQTTFYFLYSESECLELMKIFPDYKLEYYDKYMRPTEKDHVVKKKIVDKTLVILKSLLNQIPNVLYIDTSIVDEYNFTKHILTNVSSNELVFILTNDDSMGVQLTGDNTYLLETRGLKSRLLSKKRIVRTLSDVNTDISSDLLPLILSMSGNPKMGLKNIPKIGIKTAVNLVDKLVKNNVISNIRYATFPLTEETIPNRVREYYNEIKNNYEILVGDKVLYTNIREVKLSFSKPEVITNNRYLLDWNIDLFQRYPIMLDMLMKGE